jgi:predicted nucleic-acid-binding protein
MLGIDTNVLVRFLVGDDAAQSERATRLIRRQVNSGEEVFVSLPVLLETEWVLRSRYAFAKADIMNAISGLLNATELRFEHEPTVEETLYTWQRSNAEFADCLIGAHHRRLGCRATATFDAKAAKLAGYLKL